MSGARSHADLAMAIWAMQSGKDVYVEKPCSHNVEEGRVITQWARKLGRMCQMGVHSRSMTGMRETLDFVKSGKLGDVKVARAVCFGSRSSIGLVDTPAPIPPGVDFDLWAGPAPAVVPVRKRLHYDWHWTQFTGNGDLGNQNPHELDNRPTDGKVDRSRSQPALHPGIPQRLRAAAGVGQASACQSRPAQRS